MTPDDYVKLRLQNEIDWYDRKSAVNKTCFKWLSIVEVISASIIPFLAGYADYGVSIKVIIGFLGALIAVLAAIKGLLQLQKNWIDYRTTCESLKKEKFLFLTGTEPYGNEHSFKVLVQRVEALISKENTDWAQYVTKADQSKSEKQQEPHPGASG
jgi:hypothetical protein